MQGDGNLVVYSSSNKAVWASGTSGNPGSYLALGSDGQLTLDTPSGDPLWGAPGILTANAALTAGQQLTSPGGGYRLSMQADGNLVEYSGSTALWASATNGTGSYAVMQGDGNLVVYSSSNKAVWASGTSGNPGSYLLLTSSGALDLIAPNGSLLWTA
jgi:hypothetical protein